MATKGGTFCSSALISLVLQYLSGWPTGHPISLMPCLPIQRSALNPSIHPSNHPSIRDDAALCHLLILHLFRLWLRFIYRGDRTPIANAAAPPKRYAFGRLFRYDSIGGEFQRGLGLGNVCRALRDGNILKRMYSNESSIKIDWFWYANIQNRISSF